VLPRNKIVLIFLSVVCIMLFFSHAYAEDNNFILNFYKNHISVVDGNRCPMYPSCSSYASRVFKKHGAVLGWIMSSDRIVRCGRNEAGVSGRIVVNSHELIHDPVEANDFWWFNKDKNR